MWRNLLQRYAILAREYSDAVAALGREGHRGPRASEALLEQVRSRRKMCDEIADEIERYIQQLTNAAHVKVQAASAEQDHGGDTKVVPEYATDPNLPQG